VWCILEQEDTFCIPISSTSWRSALESFMFDDTARPKLPSNGTSKPVLFIYLYLPTLIIRDSAASNGRVFSEC
jgi:hypothetical protein